MTCAQMPIKPIRTEKDYKTALLQIESLMDAQPGSPEEDILDVLDARVRSRGAHGLLDGVAKCGCLMLELGLRQREVS